MGVAVGNIAAVWLSNLSVSARCRRVAVFWVRYATTTTIPRIEEPFVIIGEAVVTVAQRRHRIIYNIVWNVMIILKRSIISFRSNIIRFRSLDQSSLQHYRQTNHKLWLQRRGLGFKVFHKNTHASSLLEKKEPY